MEGAGWQRGHKGQQRPYLPASTVQMARPAECVPPGDAECWGSSQRKKDELQSHISIGPIYRLPYSAVLWEGTFSNDLIEMEQQ